MASDIPVGITPELIRRGVLAMREERARREHHNWVHTERQAGELNALDAVLRLINTGDWLTPEDRHFRQQVAAQRDLDRLQEDLCRTSARTSSISAVSTTSTTADTPTGTSRTRTAGRSRSGQRRPALRLL